MARKNKQYENIKVSEKIRKGRFVATIGEREVLLDQVIPGELVDLVVVGKKKGYKKGKVTSFRERSANRQQPFCSHFGICGGCKWQHISYQQQLEYKRNHVQEAFEHLFAPESLPAVLPSSQTTYYRNKLDFSFTNKRWLLEQEKDNDEQIDRRGVGFHVVEKFDKVVDLQHCYLQPDPSNAIRLAIRKYAKDNNLTFFDLRTKEGLLRNLIIRTSTLGEVMVLLIFGQSLPEQQEKLFDFLITQFPELTSVVYAINTKLNDSYYDLPIHLARGSEYIREKIAHLEFKIQAKTFFQVNPKQTETLYQVIANMACLTPESVVYDLYTGTGTIANYLAHRASKVIGIETIPSAIADAKLNSQHNQITNSEFLVGDVEKVLDHKFAQEYGQADVVISDPPRSGMHPKAVATLLELAPPRIVYVSCNPLTQARDIEMLQSKYQIRQMQPVDMFPHTPHVENVALLELC